MVKVDESVIFKGKVAFELGSKMAYCGSCIGYSLSDKDSQRIPSLAKPSTVQVKKPSIALEYNEHTDVGNAVVQHRRLPLARWHRWQRQGRTALKSFEASY